MREFDSYGRRLNVLSPEETAKWLHTAKFDVAATLTLLKSRRIAQGRSCYWLHGNENEYGWAYERLVHQLSERYNGRAYRRFTKLITNCATLEGDGDTKRKHIHAAFRCPDWVDVKDFVESTRFYWTTKSPWGIADIKIEPITGDWVGYMVKEGSEALLLPGASF